ncbi:MAG: amino acid adenylation domain-containing protein [Microcoleaceae cyanobacterium]
MAYLLQQLLETSAQHYCDREAVIYKDRSITYGELDQLSNQLAGILTNCGISKGDRIGIYLNKSIEAVIAIFGILKAGAAYVPLDPFAPVKRVAFIIDNCQIKGLVTTAKKAASLDLANSPVQCLVLVDDGVSEKRCGEQQADTETRRHGDAGTRRIEIPRKISFTVDGEALPEMESPSTIRVVSWQDVLQTPANSLPTATEIEDDLAYILYTSGSTGTPKGVMISHRASLTFVNWAYECFQVQASDRVSNHAPLHFDLSIFDIFTTIKAGATVILVPPELSVFPKNLAKFIEQHQITIWYSVPSVLRQLVVYGNLQQIQLPHLRTILFAGEVFPIKYLSQLMESIPQAKYYNLYGPTETNVCTYYPVQEIPSDSVQSLPLGKACANTEVFAVNSKQEITQPGEIGELYVRGSSLMKGYWGMAEKTRLTLVPFSVTGGNWEETVYRTGDLVKQDFDGNYIYLGRCDNQIKSRGYRIELDEIETTLYTHPAIEEAAVIAIPDEEIGNRIKAIVAFHQGNTLTRRDLAYFCAERLPKYMIPEFIEFHSELPKTSTGKIDKTLLRTEIESISQFRTS